jgi:hypothetical protein
MPTDAGSNTGTHWKSAWKNGQQRLRDQAQSDPPGKATLMNLCEERAEPRPSAYAGLVFASPGLQPPKKLQMPWVITTPRDWPLDGHDQEPRRKSIADHDEEATSVAPSSSSTATP